MSNENVIEEPLAPYNQPLNFEQVWKIIVENDKQITKMFQETDRQFQEARKQFQETDKKIKELSALFTTQWGKLVESLVEGDLVKILNERGISVERTVQRVKGRHDGKNYEYDIIAENSSEVVVVEVKTTLRTQDVRDFQEKMRDARKNLPRYRDMILYGAVAFILSEGSSDRMAENQGFFVIKATGSSASVVNTEGFKPKAF